MINKTKNRVLAGVLAFMMMVMALAPVQQVKAEEEPSATNISFDTARDLKFNTSITEELSSSDQTRYYKFSLSEASVMNLKYTRNSYDSLSISIYDNARTQVYYRYYNSSGFETGNIYLTGGDYYLMTKCSSSFSMIAIVDSLSESFTETQNSNNNTVSNASAIFVGTQYKGVLAQNDDKDYYKFTLTEASDVTISLTNSTGSGLKYTFYDSAVNSAYTNAIISGRKADQTITLAADSYYLAITKDSDSANGSYNFLLSSVKITEKATTTEEPQTTKTPSVQSPTILSVKNNASKKITVKWGSVSNVSGYQLQYSTKKTFKGNAKKKNVVATKVSAKVSNLKKKKTYYVRMRSYVISNGVNVYSSWSGGKKVKISK